MSIPTAVEEAIENFDPTGSMFELVPPKPSEWSVMFKWGVHVKHRERDEVDLICLGGESCRDI